MLDLTRDVTELLQHLIRNACVNDGTPASGHESRSADLLTGYLEGHGLDLQRFEPLPGRASLVARLEGYDPGAPTLLLMGHTDVVPANPTHWRHDPFGGELVDGEVWGRGALDMLCLTSSMAVALRRLALEDFRPAGTLVYLAVADEEAGGRWGTQWLLEHAPEAIRCDYVLTESGGARMPGPATDPKLAVTVAEKGACWCTLTVEGTPGHASLPLRTDNALTKAAEVVRRIVGHSEPVRIPETWRLFVEAMEYPPGLRDGLLDPEQITRLCAAHPDETWARALHACSHTTLAPTIIRSGVKANVIPDEAVLDVDVRMLPGQTADDVVALLGEILGDLRGSASIDVVMEDRASSSPIRTPLWSSLERVARKLVPGASIVPFMNPGATDARLFRRLGATAYGFGLYSERFTYPQFQSMVHGDNERVDVESLRLCTELWLAVARDLLA